MSQVSKEQAINAIKTLLSYIGLNQEDEHLNGTAKRVINSFDELYGGYKKTAHDVIGEKFYTPPAGSQDTILLKNIDFSSTCAHHMLPIIGNASIAYIPNEKIVGISKIVKIIQVFARRLQIQENMTAEIAHALQENLQPQGVAIKISATHHCMVSRGVQQRQTLMDTYFFTGIFKEDRQLKNEFINSLR